VSRWLAVGGDFRGGYASVDVPGFARQSDTDRFRFWEYAGLMMHAKTIVADGWWARVGSTNMNVTGLLTNWEIDLVAEDRRFAAAMEAMYEDDLANAREIGLAGRRRGPRPTRPESRAERDARQHRPRVRSSGSAGLARVSAAIQTASSDSLKRNERTIGVILLAISLGYSLTVMALLRMA